MISISVVSPVYNAELIVSELVEQLERQFKNITRDYEIILVEDRSSDGSWSEIVRICKLNSRVVGIRLSRNFGQHCAISAGLARSKNELVVVLDCDLQDQPSEIPKMLSKVAEGYDAVLARREIRRDSLAKRIISRCFYSILSYLTGVRHDPAIANFGVYTRKVIKAINEMPETIKYFPTMVQWVGFNIIAINVVHAERFQGKSSYDFRKLLKLSVDICLANSDKPLRLVVKTGFIVSLTGLAFAAFTIYLALRGEIKVLGYASLLVSVWVLAGLIIFIIGIVGLYVGKSFEGIKNRPAYIVDEVVSSDP